MNEEEKKQQSIKSLTEASPSTYSPPNNTKNIVYYRFNNSRRLTNVVVQQMSVLDTPECDCNKKLGIFFNSPYAWVFFKNHKHPQLVDFKQAVKLKQDAPQDIAVYPAPSLELADRDASANKIYMK